VDCPSCSGSTRILETRRADDGRAVRRRRQCPSCGQRFTTFERAEPESLFVIKRDGGRQPFDRAKLRGGLLRAAHKRPVDPADVEALVDRIAGEIRAAGGELPSQRVGELCLEGLQDLDLGAYVQFAAVYRQLADVDAIRAELGRLGADQVAGGGGAAIRRGNPRKQRRWTLPGSVRSEEDAAVLPPESE
jgi:transcriptional repressor NrdR